MQLLQLIRALKVWSNSHRPKRILIILLQSSASIIIVIIVNIVIEHRRSSSSSLTHAWIRDPGRRFAKPASKCKWCSERMHAGCMPASQRRALGQKNRTWHDQLKPYNLRWRGIEASTMGNHIATAPHPWQSIVIAAAHLKLQSKRARPHTCKMSDRRWHSSRCTCQKSKH